MIKVCREVPLSEYNELIARSLKLDALENWGVDNWSGYEDAMEEMRGAN